MTTTAEITHAEQQLVICDLASETYGIDIEAVREIIHVQEITQAPQSPKFVEGIIDLRGQVIPVVNLRERFNLSEGDRNKDSCIVVVDIEGRGIGLMVDAVTEVLSIDSGSVVLPSSIIMTADSVYLRGIAKLEGRLIILLDLQRVLPDRERDDLANVADTARLERTA